MEFLEKYCSSRTDQVPSRGGLGRLFGLPDRSSIFPPMCREGDFFQSLRTSICLYFLKRFMSSKTQVLYILGLSQREDFGYKIPNQHPSFANVNLSKFFSLVTGFWKQASKVVLPSCGLNGNEVRMLLNFRKSEIQICTWSLGQSLDFHFRSGNTLP